MSIEFLGNCLTVLSHSLLAAKPNEGCALLLGSHRQSSCLEKQNILQVQMIWPCCNVWGMETFHILDLPKKINIDIKEDLSKKNRFVIDPREQLLANRWARERNWEILGSAHSHPNGEPIPSLVDCYWTFSTGLIVIIGKYGDIRAWWMVEDQIFNTKEVAILSSK